MRLTDAGNAILICTRCGGEVDKGCPPIDGQYDGAFVCATCADAQNAQELTRLLAIMLPKRVLR